MPICDAISGSGLAVAARAISRSDGKDMLVASSSSRPSWSWPELVPLDRPRRECRTSRLFHDPGPFRGAERRADSRRVPRVQLGRATSTSLRAVQQAHAAPRPRQRGTAAGQLARSARACRRWLPSHSRHARRPGDRVLLVLEVDQRDELHRPKAGSRRSRHQQHRLLQPHLTRSQRGRSGHSVRSWRWHLVVRGDRGHRCHRDVGLERARRASDLLPPRAAGCAQRRQALRRRPAPQLDGAVRRCLARSRGRHRRRAVEHDRPRDHPRRSRQHGLHRARHHRLRRVRGVGRGVDARARLAGHRSSR